MAFEEYAAGGLGLFTIEDRKHRIELLPRASPKVERIGTMGCFRYRPLQWHMRSGEPKGAHQSGNTPLKAIVSSNS